MPRSRGGGTRDQPPNQPPGVDRCKGIREAQSVSEPTTTTTACRRHGVRAQPRLHLSTTKALTAGRTLAYSAGPIMGRQLLHASCC